MINQTKMKFLRRVKKSQKDETKMEQSSEPKKVTKGHKRKADKVSDTEHIKKSKDSVKDKRHSRKHWRLHAFLYFIL